MLVLCLREMDNNPVTHCVKVGNDLIEQPKALHPFIVGLKLYVELGEVCDGSEHDANIVNIFIIQILAERKEII